MNFSETSRVAGIPSVADELNFAAFSGVRYITVLSNRFTLDSVSFLTSLHTIF